MLKIVSSESPKNFAPRPTLSVLFFSKEKLNCTPPRHSINREISYLTLALIRPLSLDSPLLKTQLITYCRWCMCMCDWLTHYSGTIPIVFQQLAIVTSWWYSPLSPSSAGQGKGRELGTQPAKFFLRKPYYSLQYFQINVWLERKCATCRCSGLTVRAMNFGQWIRVLDWLGSVCCGTEQDILSSRCSS